MHVCVCVCVQLLFRRMYAALVLKKAGGRRRPKELCPTKLSMVTSWSCGTDHPSAPAVAMATRLRRKPGKPISCNVTD